MGFFSFFQKLQHIQMESEKEITGLKQTITNLQQSLNEQLQKAQAPSGDGTHKRAKKFWIETDKFNIDIRLLSKA